MKTFNKWNYNNGKMEINIDLIVDHHILEMNRNVSIWNAIFYRDIKLETKTTFNKKKTILEEGFLTIKSKISSSYIKIRITQKNSGFKFKFVELSLSKFEINYFKKHLNICLLNINILLNKYLEEKVLKITQEGVKALKDETKTLKRRFESF